MKKISLSLSFSLLIITAAFGQDDVVTEPVINQQKLRFGAFVAPTLSWMRPANNKSNDGAYAVSNNGSKVGFTWGLMVDYWFADNYAFATGLHVNGTGGHIRSNRIDENLNPNTVYTTDFNYSLQYLELPLNLKLKTSPVNSTGLHFFGQAGLTAGFNIGKKASYEVKATDNSNNLLTYEEEKVKIGKTFSVAPVMLQLNVGAGAQYPFSDRLTAYAGIFFNNGFAPDATNPAKYNFTYPGSFADGNIRLNNFALRVGLYF